MKKILIIDDKNDNLISMKALLKNYFPEYNVIIAQSGAEGLEIARKENPDAILLDIIMPGMDGYEVCMKLKENKSTRHIPVTLITAIETDSVDRVKGMELGADSFLSKPIDPAELMAQVKVMLRISKAENNLRDKNADLEKLVDEKTKVLVEMNKKLIFEVDERREAEKTLRDNEVELKRHRDELEILIQERTEKLEKKNKQLEEYNELFVGREFRIKELRDIINAYREKFGEIKLNSEE